MEYGEVQIRVESVKVVGRHRKDLGDVKSLAQSIQELGLINPITVTEDGDLIAGQRRLEAFRLLGREMIPARVVSDLAGAMERLRIERDENTERKEMTPEELVSVGKKLEELVRPEAKARQREGQERGRGRRYGAGSPSIDGEPADDPVVEPRAHHGTTTRYVAEAVGMKPTNYHRAKKVVEAATDPTLEPEDRKVAQAALEEMNTTGRMWTPYETVRKIKTKAKPIEAHESAAPPPPTKATVVGAARQRKAIAAALATLSGVAHGFDQIVDIHADITSTEAALWVDGLGDARRSITALINRLKERTN